MLHASSVCHSAQMGHVPPGASPSVAIKWITCPWRHRPEQTEGVQGGGRGVTSYGDSCTGCSGGAGLGHGVGDQGSTRPRPGRHLRPVVCTRPPGLLRAALLLRVSTPGRGTVADPDTLEGSGVTGACAPGHRLAPALPPEARVSPVDAESHRGSDLSVGHRL